MGESRQHIQEEWVDAYRGLQALAASCAADTDDDLQDAALAALAQEGGIPELGTQAHAALSGHRRSPVCGSVHCTLATMSRWTREDPQAGWLPAHLPETLEPYAAALIVVDVQPDLDQRQWYPAGFPDAPRLPFSDRHYHPAIQGGHAGVHWDGILPVYPCARLDLAHTAISGGLAEALRTHAAPNVGIDDAVYTYGLSHRSQHRCREEALTALAALILAARLADGVVLEPNSA